MGHWSVRCVWLLMYVLTMKYPLQITRVNISNVIVIFSSFTRLNNEDTLVPQRNNRNSFTLEYGFEGNIVILKKWHFIKHHNINLWIENIMVSKTYLFSRCCCYLPCFAYWAHAGAKRRPLEILLVTRTYQSSLSECLPILISTRMPLFGDYGSPGNGVNYFLRLSF